MLVANVVILSMRVQCPEKASNQGGSQDSREQPEVKCQFSFSRQYVGSERKPQHAQDNRQ